MEKILKTLFGTADRTVVSVIVGVVFVGMTASGAINNLGVAINENQAATPEAALDRATINAQLAGKCFGDKTPRVFLTWPAINGTIQKQTDRGAWVSLTNSNRKTFYVDWDASLGTQYAYRIKKSQKTVSNILRLRVTAAGCTVTPIAAAATSTVPGHIAPFYTDETIRFSVIGEPNRPVQLCYKFTSNTTPPNGTTVCEPQDASFNQKTTVDGTWSKEKSFGTGSVTAWFLVQNQKSNVLQFSVISPPAIPTGLTATPGSLACDETLTPITLTWDVAPGAVSYTVGKSTVSGGPYITVATNLTSTTYSDQESRSGQYYVVSSTDQYGRASQFSVEVLADFFPGTCPTPTQNADLSVARAPDSPASTNVYWGQIDVPFSKLRFSSTQEGFYLTKFTLRGGGTGTQVSDFTDNVLEVGIRYRNKAGQLVTKKQLFSSLGIATFTWPTSDQDAPYVPKDSVAGISVVGSIKSADQQVRPEGAQISIDFSGEAGDFLAHGEDSGIVLDGTSPFIIDIAGNSMTVYQSF
ncbi:MAG: hypothetical protein AAB483_01715 [Patescibacteria group bacterium]